MLGAFFKVKNYFLITKWALFSMALPSPYVTFNCDVAIQRHEKQVVQAVKCPPLDGGTS